VILLKIWTLNAAREKFSEEKFRRRLKFSPITQNTKYAANGGDGSPAPTAIVNILIGVALTLWN
jgi:hypothetical protein